MTREEVIQFLLDTGETPKNIMKFVEALSNHTDTEIQKMQDLEQAEIQKAYELGREDTIKIPDKIETAIMQLYHEMEVVFNITRNPCMSGICLDLLPQAEREG